MKRFRWTPVILLSAAIAAAMCSGCSGGQSDNIVMESGRTLDGAREVGLTFFGFKADALNLTAIETALHGFMDQNPNITITYESIKGKTYWEVFDKRVASGNMDDIMMVDHDTVMALSAENKLADLSELSTIGNFETMARSQFIEKDGSVHFLPTCISAYGLYINLDLMEEHGQRIPENLAEFTQVCDYFAAQGIAPIIINNYYSLRFLMTAKSFYPVYQKENPVEEIEKLNSGQSDIVELLRPGVELTAMMIEHGWFDCEEALVTNQTSDDLVLFAEGERPFMITGAWASPRVAAMEPGFDYKVYPFPVLEDGSVLLMNVDTCIGVNADSENLEEAKQLVEYLTQTDVMWEYCDSQSSFTPLKDDRIPSDSSVEPLVKYLTNGQSVIGSDYNLEIPLDGPLIECGNQMLMGMGADEAMELLSGLFAD